VRFSFSLLVRSLLFLVCASALYRVVRLTVADLMAARCLPCAIRIEPSSEKYVARYALGRARSDDSSHEVDAELKRALELNPRDSDVLRSIALRLELNGDRASAERYLKQAVAVDHMFASAWALANFYFRSGQESQFWGALRSCLHILQVKPQLDPDQAFDLAWRMTSDSKRILSQIPSGPDILLPYMNYLVQTSRVEALLEVLPSALATAPAPATETVRWFAPVCDYLIQENRTGPAVSVWNRMVESGGVKLDRLEPATGHSLADPALKLPSYERGFGWHIAHNESLFAATADNPLTLEFGSNPAEHFDLLSTIAPVLPGREYVLSWKADGSALDADSQHDAGLAVHLIGPTGEVSACPALLSATRCEFNAGAATQLKLTLRYDRPMGKLRLQGVLRIDRFGLAWKP
jgi:hypothetical protein